MSPAGFNQGLFFLSTAPPPKKRAPAWPGRVLPRMTAAFLQVTSVDPGGLFCPVNHLGPTQGAPLAFGSGPSCLSGCKRAGLRMLQRRLASSLSPQARHPRTPGAEGRATGLGRVRRAHAHLLAQIGEGR